MKWLRFVLAGLLLGLFAGSLPARAETEVDLALVIAVDVSYSMDEDEQELQREGYAEAFRSPLVHDAIRNGSAGRIAVTYMEWSSASEQWIMLPWTVLDNPEGILAFADRISHIPLRRAQLTSISGALDRASQLFESSGLMATRRVVDVSGDGSNNDGRPVTAARDEAIAKGIVINGLPITLKTPNAFDTPNLERYYRDCVIGGPGAFIVPARERAQFQTAIKMKILREVSSTPGLMIQLAQAQEPRADCTADGSRN
ncbi:DUF1194 domain-containing protein [Microvirga puerhi]|uniref:DUF1194 domain-containing protein n=1 Tax=Microvirga puerhi TaxID=2876078 RepID=A0ABS7VNU9_9HYPH|nr:DUF1194 domain-containing protein [Microvirga puerhi]MBZ6077223.1 DUF1194 domain-containing protein [Microvirga puerhi]